ncbi:MAG: YigZ family protein, partial [Clostridia bacterium]|nr:YigZ family protein [Clostridia bacterium]
GEPAGSAGAPIYQAIREKKVTNVLVAVVRFFGGVELGKSRLTRTYYSAALNALNNARKNKMVYCGIFDMKVTYSDYAILGKVLAEKGFPILEKNFDESMPLIKCAIPVENAEKAIEEIRTKIKDSAQMIKVDSMYYRFSYNG